MKAYRFLLGLCMAAAMVACSNDDLVDPQAASSQEHAIGFVYKAKNMSRDGEAKLQTLAGDFGVWGYKTADASESTGLSTNAVEVFRHYLVGYGDSWGDNYPGYDYSKATTFGDQTSTTDGKSYWFYEGLGKSEYAGGSGYIATSASSQANQYLKYWDEDAQYYYFYAHAPYDATVSFTAATSSAYSKMEWANAITQGNTVQSNVMYGQKQVTGHNDYADVPIQFTRINGQLEVGFYETIDGYDVEMVDYSQTVYGSVDMESCAFGVASDLSTSVNNENVTIKKYSWSTYTNSAKPVVEFTSTSAASVSWTGYGRTTTYVDQSTITDVAKGFFRYAAPSGDISDDASNPTFSDTKYYVVPANSANKNSGLLFFVSYKIKAKDTDETITVRNAKVYVPDTYTQWDSNKVYKYIFKITAKAPGGDPDPDDPDEPTPPGPDDPILQPIVFDSCTVTDMETGETTIFDMENGATLPNQSDEDDNSGDNTSGDNSGSDNS